jgi:hypothetical protein
MRAIALAALSAAMVAFASSAAAAVPLGARLIREGDIPGLTPDAHPITFSTPKSWVAQDPRPSPAQRSAQVTRLQREGFKYVLVLYLARGKATQEGVEWVMQLGSAAAARAEAGAVLAFNVKQNIAGTTTFAVPDVPGARAYRVGSSSQGGGENVLFADGPYLYLVGQGWESGQKPPPLAPFLAGVRKLYARVHGR